MKKIREVKEIDEFVFG